MTNRTRISAGVCLALTLGTVINVFGLQGIRRPPLAAVADAFPAAPIPPFGKSVAPAATSAQANPVGQLSANADADLSVRAAGIGRPAGLPAADSPPADDKLIAAIQRELAARGYDPGRINGAAGIITRAAILAFEFDQHFPLTGEPSEELMRRIVLGLSGSANESAVPPGEKARRIIAGAQRLLLRLGYDPGPVNAQLDEVTRKALRRFEADAGLTPKGRVSGEIIAELARRAHARMEVSDEALSH